MTFDEVINYFGSKRKVCKALCLAPQNFRQWEKFGYIPLRNQIKLQKITNGELKADLEDIQEYYRCKREEG